jgi:MFS family permease
MLLFALAANAVGCFALAIAHDYPMMILYAAGTGIGFGLTIVATTVLLLEYYGREHNLEIFSLTCLVGALSALGPVIAGIIRDNFGSFAPAFQIYGVAIALVGFAAIFMRPPVRKSHASVQGSSEPHAMLVPSE